MEYSVAIVQMPSAGKQNWTTVCGSIFFIDDRRQRSFAIRITWILLHTRKMNGHCVPPSISKICRHSAFAEHKHTHSHILSVECGLWMEEKGDKENWQMFVQVFNCSFAHEIEQTHEIVIPWNIMYLFSSRIRSALVSIGYDDLVHLSQHLLCKWK